MVLNVVSKTTKQILVIFLLILLFVGEYAHCPTPPSLPLGLLVIYYYLLFIIYKVNRCLASYSPRATTTGEIKSFVTHITENPPRHLVHIGFWSGIGQNVQ